MSKPTKVKFHTKDGKPVRFKATKTGTRKSKPKPDDYRQGMLQPHSRIVKNSAPLHNRVLVAIPMTGVIRAEFALARWSQVIPTNWSAKDLIQWVDTFSPLGFMVADARNVCVQEAVTQDFEWLLFIDHDVVLPSDAFIRINDYMRERKWPVVSGLYFTKSNPAEPLIYRGRGNSYFADWEIGDKVPVDGVPMGITLIHVPLLKAMYEESEEYLVGSTIVRRVFETPAKVLQNPETMSTHMLVGTEDLAWCTRVMTENFLEKSGWKKHQKMEFPFLMDTNIFCRHVDMNGVQYPLHWQEIQSMLVKRQQAELRKKK